MIYFLLVLAVCSGGFVWWRSARSAPETPAGAGMETLREAMTRLEHAGYSASFCGSEGVVLDPRTRMRYTPEELRVDEIVRFEGASDPQDEAILYALSHVDSGARGTLLVHHGPGADPANAEVARRLPEPESAHSAPPISCPS